MENIRYSDAVGAAWNRMKFILFQPFNIEKWFLMGFAAWIAGLNSGGGGGSGGGGNSFSHTEGGAHDSLTGPIRDGWSEFLEFWHEYGMIIVGVSAIVISIILVLSIAFAWLHARGKFIFLDNVLHNRGAIVEPWKKYRKQGNSLFLWNLAIGLIGVLFFIITALLCVPMILPMVANEGPVGLGIFGILLAVLLGLTYMITFSFIQMLVYDFVMPIMLKYDLRIREGWSRFNQILKPAFGTFVIYGLMRFGVSIMISIAVMAAFLLTCCCLLLISCIPFIGTVLMLPVFVFVRLISIEFLRQFGENIDQIVPLPEEEIPALP